MYKILLNTKREISKLRENGVKPKKQWQAMTFLCLSSEITSSVKSD